MPDIDRLAAMRDLDITAIERDTLVELGAVGLDTVRPAAERREVFLRQVKNPYCFLCGDTPVRIRFVAGDRTLAEALGGYFRRLK